MNAMNRDTPGEAESVIHPTPVPFSLPAEAENVAAISLRVQVNTERIEAQIEADNENFAKAEAESVIHPPPCATSVTSRGC